MDVNERVRFGSGMSRNTWMIALAFVVALTIPRNGHAAEFLTMQGTATILGNAFSVGDSTFAVSESTVGIRTTRPAMALDVNGGTQFGTGGAASTFGHTGALGLAPNASLALSGPDGNLVSGASITASAFFGDGGGLTGVLPAPSNSSSTVNGFSGTTSAVDGVCAATVTITVAANSRIRISVAGDWFSTNGYPKAKLQLNDADISPFTGNYWIGDYVSIEVIGLTILTDSLTSGQKKITLWLGTTSGVARWGEEAYPNRTSPMVMTIEEVPQ
ncbi:MAG: hypothetical protein HY924_15565 [Elusimicrobia bacterium]|nr:hypothetical protein [Elusimicrobiota bacterium]